MAWPLLSRGFQIVRDQKNEELDPAVLLFSGKYLEQEGSAREITRFKKEWNKTVAKINADPEAYRALLMKHARIPKIPGKDYTIPHFRPINPPTEEQVDDVIQWFAERQGLERGMSYQDLVME